MQRVSSLLPSWDRRASTSSTGLGANNNHNSNHNHKAAGSGGGSGGLFGWSNRSSTSTIASTAIDGLAKLNIGAANRNSTAASIKSARVQRETFWPGTLDVESEKAARIIKSFCADGYLAPLNSDEPNSHSKSSDEPQTPLKVPKKIPKRILQNAAGIAVFTCMRNGLWMTGSGGSGLLIARKSDGTWSPPSGIVLHTPTLSFIIGVDVYDCVLIINSLAALESISQPRVTLGEDVSLAGGALVSLEQPDTGINTKELGNTVMTYMKSRGQAQVVNLHGCILTERSNENERFYGAPLSPMDILSGNVTRHVEEIQPLLEVIKLAEGRSDFDPSLVAKVAREPAPGDAMIASPSSTPASPRQKFGHVSSDDPDPFGILALEMAGLEIREAGSKLRPASSQMDLHAQRMSQMSRIQRQSGDTYVSRSNRESCVSNRTVKSQVTDAYTQTNSPETSPSPGRSEDGRIRASFDDAKTGREEDKDEEIDYTTVDLTALEHLSPRNRSQETLADSAKAGMSRDAALLNPKTKYGDTDEVSKASSTYGSIYEDDDGDDPRGRNRYSDDLVDEKADKADKAGKADRVAKVTKNADEDADDEDDDSDLSDDEEPVVFEVATVQARSTQAMASRVVHAKGNVVTIPKRLPPPLPARNPARASLTSKSDLGGDASSLHSPLRQAFSETDLNSPKDTSDHEAGIAANEVRAQTPPPSSAFKASVPRIEEPQFNTPMADVAQHFDSAPSSDAAKEAEVGVADAPRRSTDSPPAKRHSELTSTEDMDFSDTNRQDRLSVDTRMTDDVSSFEGSSYTTPTSERQMSLPDATRDHEKEQKPADNISPDDTPTQLPKRNPRRLVESSGSLSAATSTATTNGTAETV